MGEETVGCAGDVGMGRQVRWETAVEVAVGIPSGLVGVQVAALDLTKVILGSTDSKVAEVLPGNMSERIQLTTVSTLSP